MIGGRSSWFSLSIRHSPLWTTFLEILYNSAWNQAVDQSWEEIQVSKSPPLCRLRCWGNVLESQTASLQVWLGPLIVLAPTQGCGCWKFPGQRHRGRRNTFTSTHFPSVLGESRGGHLNVQVLLALRQKSSALLMGKTQARRSLLWCSSPVPGKLLQTAQEQLPALWLT